MVYKVAFFLPSLEGGGAEKNVINFVKYLDKKKYRVSLILAEKKGVFLNELPKDIIVKDLGGAFIFNVFIKLIGYFKEESPDIFISTFDRFNLVNLSAKFFSGKRFNFVIMEQTTPSNLFITAHTVWRKITVYLFLPFLLKFFYPKARAIVCVSNGVKDDLLNIIGSYKNVRVIYNPILEKRIYDLAQENVDHPWFSEGDLPVVATVGRLVKAKNYQVLLRAFSLILKEKDVRLMIIGEGQERDNLINLAKKLGISKNVCFLGFQKNPYKYLAKSAVFVVSSLREGFSNSLIEAMACGLPVVATECPGPMEIIGNKKNGILVPVGNPKLLAAATLKILNNPILSKSLSESGKTRAQFFTIEKSIKEYQNFFEELLNGNK